MKTEPIKDQEEFNEVYAYLVKTAVETLGISEDQATKRINAIRESGILTQLGPPDGQPFQIGIDVAMRIPQP